MSENVEIEMNGNITVDVLADGAKLRFADVNELAAWTANERETWQKIASSDRTSRGFSETIVGPQVEFFDQLEELCSRVADGDSSSLEELENHLELVADGSVPHRESVAGQQILAAFERDPVLAVAYLAWGPREDIDLPASRNPNLLQFVRAMVEARLDQRLGVDDVSAQEEALTLQRRRWDDRFSAVEQEQKATIDRFEGDRQEGQELFANSLQKGRELLARALRMNLRLRRTLNRTHAAYTTHMKMMASEIYWNDRKTANEGRAKFYMGVFLTFTVIGACALALAFYLEELFLPLQNPFGTLHVFAYGVPTLLVIWILRLLYGQYRSARDVATDADERMAMISTFKALEYEGKASDAERAIVLHALFRPYKQDSDEGVPHPIWEAVLKRLGGTQS